MTIHQSLAATQLPDSNVTRFTLHGNTLLTEDVKATTSAQKVLICINNHNPTVVPFATKTIYDLGSNNGDDIPYYLLKAEKVIAVEANPVLCRMIAERFRDYILTNRLVVENCAITDYEDGEIDFYIHKKYHVLSTLLPHKGGFEDFEKTRVQAVSLAKLINKHGPPYYLKIDIEGYDEKILGALASLQIKPPYISAESHMLGVFSLLSEKMAYKSFKLVDGDSVNRVYGKALIFSPILQRNVAYSFPYHSAGPFGDDIHGEWMDKNAFLKVLAMRGLGWKDIHASEEKAPTLSF